jgi:hypothetical protein
MMLRTFNQATDIRGIHDDSREREFVISNERRDSHGTIIKMNGWDIEDYNRSGAFYYQHMTATESPDNVLGPGKAIKEDGQLIGRAYFEPGDINPLAEKIMRKVDFGTLSSTSVGFMPTAGHWGVERMNEDPETYYFDGTILKEFSIVNIPSNPDAIKKSLESFDHYMMAQTSEHKSEGFKRDYKYKINQVRRQREYLLSLAAKRYFI